MAQFDRALADGVVTVRPFDRSDRDALLRSRDDEFLRFLGEGSSEPAPRACICVAATIVGWIDYDDERHWLHDDEVNIGYNVFAEHRGKGYGTRAIRLLCRLLEAQVPPRRPTLLIDPDNAPSLALAARAGSSKSGTSTAMPLQAIGCPLLTGVLGRVEHSGTMAQVTDRSPAGSQS